MINTNLVSALWLLELLAARLRELQEAQRLPETVYKTEWKHDQEKIQVFSAAL